MAVTVLDVPTSTIDAEPSGSPTISAGTSRAAILTLFAENTDASLTVSVMTIGGQTYTQAYEQYVEDGTDDYVCYRYLWNEAAIDAMSGTTISYTDDRTLAKRGWAFETFEGVDQSSFPKGQAETDYTVDEDFMRAATISNLADRISVAITLNSNTPTIDDWGRLTEDVNGNINTGAAKMAIGSGRGGSDLSVVEISGTGANGAFNAIVLGSAAGPLGSSVHRLGGVDTTQDWVSAAASPPTGSPDIAAGLNRCFIIVYGAEHNTTTPTPTITVGGIAPTIANPDIFSTSVDLHLYTFLWDEAAIASMTGTTVSRIGTWPTTADEAWAHCTFGNVNQTAMVATTEQGDETSQTVYTRDTTSTQDEMILVFHAVNASGADVTDTDTLMLQLDLNGGGMALCIAEGTTGDDTTSITTDLSSNYNTRSIVLASAGERFHVMHATENNDDNVSSTGWTDISGASGTEFGSEQFDNGQDYMCVIRMGPGGVDNSHRYENRLQVQDPGGQFGQSYSQVEARAGGTSNYHPYFYMESFTMSSGVRNTRQFDNQSSVVTSTFNAYTMYNSQTWFKLSDIDGLYNYAEDSTLILTLDNVGWTDGAAVTIGNGTDDYMIMWFTHALVNSTLYDYKVKVVIDGTDAMDEISLQGESASEQWCIGGMVYAPAVASSVVAKVQMQTNNATADRFSVDRTRIFAVPLNIFEDFFGNRDTGDTTIVDPDTLYNQVEQAHTVSTVEAEDWIIGGEIMIDSNVESNKATMSHLIEATLGTLSGDTTDNRRVNGPDDVTGHDHLGIEPLIADTTSMTWRMEGGEEGDTLPTPIIIDGHIFGFTARLAEAAASGIAVFLNSYRQRQ